jgi:hypothetical protein
MLVTFKDLKKRVSLLKELVKHQDIERDISDFKSTKLNKLDEVLCAMANTITDKWISREYERRDAKFHK